MDYRREAIAERLKGTDLTKITQNQLDQAASSLNTSASSLVALPGCSASDVVVSRAEVGRIDCLRACVQLSAERSAAGVGVAESTRSSSLKLSWLYSRSARLAVGGLGRTSQRGLAAYAWNLTPNQPSCRVGRLAAQWQSIYVRYGDGWWLPDGVSVASAGSSVLHARVCHRGGASVVIVHTSCHQLAYEEGVAAAVDLIPDDAFHPRYSVIEDRRSRYSL